jgi:predicted acylesterase/phospholipase RssA
VSVSPETTPQELPRIGVVTIQGGGAVAIDLIGQLQGLVGPPEADGAPTGDAGVVPAAIAGTSAGAIIATLFWLGYRPEEILGIVQRVFAPGRIDRFFAGKQVWPGLGFSGFARMAALLRALRRPWLFARLLVCPPTGRPLWIFVWWWWAWQLLTLLAGPPITLLLIAVKRGIFPGSGFVDEIDRLVRESRLVKPFRDRLRTTGRVTFGDIEAHAEPERLMPLFLIVTDVASGNLVRVCSFAPEHADIPVAEAVRASAGFPLFFRPTRFSNKPAGDSCLIDGGIVSNFPSWVFAQGYRKSLLTSQNPFRENAAFLPWIHYGLRLPRPEAPVPTESGGAFLKGLANLLTGRARGRLEDLLAQTVVRRRDVVPIAPAPGEGPAGVLDFSPLARSDFVQAAFARGRTAGCAAVRAADFALPADDSIEPILKALTTQATSLLAAYLRPGGRVRANIFVPCENTLVLRYRHNMVTEDNDYRMRLRSDQGVTGLVFTNRQLAIANLRTGRLHSGTPTGGDPFLRQAGAPAVHPDCSWLMALPVVDMTEAWAAAPSASPLALDFTGPIFGVLNLDAALDYDRPDVGMESSAAWQSVLVALLDSMKSASLRIGRAFDDVFQETDNARKRPSHA